MTLTSLNAFRTLFGKGKQPLDYLEDQPFVSGVLVGLAAGVAVGLLVAPRSGKELRKKIADTVDDQAKEAKQQWVKTKSQAKDAVDNIKTNASLMTDSVVDKFDVYADKSKEKAEELAR